MATASFIKEGLQQEFLECPICLDSFKNPRSLPCLHVCCFDCLVRYKKGKNTFPCPMCKADTDVPKNGVQGFPVAFHINALGDFVKRCGPRKPDRVACYHKVGITKHDDAHVKCLDCNVYYCKKCNKAHKMAAVAKHHRTIALADLTQEHFEKEKCCRHNVPSSLQHYCKEATCQILVCEKCITFTEHKLHEIIDIQEASSQCRSENKQILENDIPDAEKALEKREGKVRREIDKVNVKFDGNKTKIRDRYLNMVEELKKQERRLVEDAERSRDENIQFFQQQLIEIEKKRSSLGNTRGVLEIMTKSSSDDVILKQHKEIQDKVAKVLDEAMPSKLWIRDTEVTPFGEYVVDMKFVVNSKSRTKIKSLNRHLCVNIDNS